MSGKPTTLKMELDSSYAGVMDDLIQCAEAFLQRFDVSGSEAAGLALQALQVAATRQLARETAIAVNQLISCEESLDYLSRPTREVIDARLDYARRQRESVGLQEMLRQRSQRSGDE